MVQRPGVVAGLRLVRLVGSGGEGEVWEARDGAGRRRALKLIAPAMLAEPEAVRQRAAWLTRIGHPALVRVHRSGLLHGVLEGWGFVEMDLVEGPSMEDVRADPGILARLEGLAEALDLLHTGAWSDGVPLVHRDVKPANILDAGRHLVLVDPSTLRGADATLLTRIGTPLYAAPEVVTGRVGPPADVYSFAATTVALLTGARGDALAELLMAPDFVDVPGGIRLALSPAPGDRPVSCRAALERTIDLRDIATPASVVDAWTPTDSWPPVAEWRPLRLWPWLAALAAVAATVAGLLTGLVPGELAPVVAVVAVVVHLLLHALARRSLLPAVVVPPLSWATLVAQRGAPPGPARRWLEATLAVWLSLLAAVAVAGASSLVTIDVAVVFLAGCLAGALASVAARGSTLLRVVLLPVWLAGAATLVLAGAVLLPVALLFGRARALARFVAGHATAVRAFAPTAW